MNPNQYFNSMQSRNMLAALIMGTVLVTALIMPDAAFAQNSDLAGTDTKICTFFQNVNFLLNAASIVVVTIAVIFSGYQIAFAHKRIAEVAPALVGGVLIGAAAQVAKMVVGGSGSATACQSSSGATSMLMHSLNSAVQYLQHYA